jgi:dTDP-4-dehydrorhamnose 3,5-epimerase
MKSKIKDFEIYESEIIKGVFVFKPSMNIDFRGSLYTTFHNDIFSGYLPEGLFFKHDKFSKSNKNVLRGIHGDTQSWKLVTVVYGKILQVVVDCRKDSPTYLKHEKFEIDDANPISVLIPPGLGNSFLVLSDHAVYHYKLAYNGEYLDAEQQFSVKWNDSNIGIEWPIENPILSERDK